MLDLADGEIEKGHAVPDLERRFREAAHPHRRAQATVELEDGDFVQDGDVDIFGQGGVGHDHFGGRGIDVVPNTVEKRSLFVQCHCQNYPQLLRFGAFGEVAIEDGKEGLHLRVEDLYKRDERGWLVPILPK